MIIKRLLTLAIAYLAACLVAGVILTDVTLVGGLPSLSDFTLVSLQGLAFFVGFHSALVMAFAFVPAVIGVLLTERAGTVAAWVYALAGAISGPVGLLVPVLVGAFFGMGLNNTPEDSSLWQAWAAIVLTMIVTGAAAGLTFWLVAIYLPKKTRVLTARAGRMPPASAR